MGNMSISMPDMEQLFSAIPAGTVQWIVYCPEEKAQLGEAMGSSEQAFTVQKRHNQLTGHTATVNPYFDNPALEGLNDSGQVQNVVFCILYDGRTFGPYFPLGSTSEEIEMSVANIIRTYNETAVLMGLPPLFTAIAGACRTPPGQ